LCDTGWISELQEDDLRRLSHSSPGLERLDLSGRGCLWKGVPAAQRTLPGVYPQPNHPWSVYHIRGTPAQLIGIVYDQPDEQAAIKQAIDEFKVPANQRERLIAQRRDWAEYEGR
jgi:hypothetical protein